MAELASEERVACRTPAPGKSGVTRIPRWKFDLVRNAILEILGEGEARFSDLSGLARERLPEAELGRLGSLGWHVATVKLEMEVRGEIERLPGKGPQRLAIGGRGDAALRRS